MNYFHIIPLESLWNYSTLENFEHIQVDQDLETSETQISEDSQGE